MQDHVVRVDHVDVRLVPRCNHAAIPQAHRQGGLARQCLDERRQVDAVARAAAGQHIGGVGRIADHAIVRAAVSQRHDEHVVPDQVARLGEIALHFAGIGAEYCLAAILQQRVVDQLSGGNAAPCRLRLQAVIRREIIVCRIADPIKRADRLQQADESGIGVLRLLGQQSRAKCRIAQALDLFGERQMRDRAEAGV